MNQIQPVNFLANFTQGLQARNALEQRKDMYHNRERRNVLEDRQDQDYKTNRNFLLKQQSHQEKKMGWEEGNQNFLVKQQKRQQEERINQDAYTIYSHLDPSADDFEQDFQAAAQWFKRRNPGNDEFIDSVVALPADKKRGFIREARLNMSIDKPEEHEKTSNLAKLLQEQQEYEKGSRGWQFYENKIAKETTSKGMVIESDGKGGMSIRTNADQKGGGDLTKPVRTAVQKGILDSTDNMARIAEIETLYNPDFQLIGTKLNASWLATKDKLGHRLSEEEEKLFDDFTQYKAASGQMVADTLKKLSGAAVTEHEAKRAYEYIPKPGTGWFDGDSPRQIQAKIQRFKKFTRRATARLNFINNHGMSIKDIPLDNIDGLIDRRGDTLEKEIQAQFPEIEGAELETRVKQKLSEEFGLVF